MKLLLFALLFGCSGTIYGPPIRPIRKFSPEPLIEESTRKALARWVTVSGISLQIDEAGIPLILQDDWIYINNKPNCGNTDFVNEEIILTTKKEKCTYFSFDSLILHEVGHAIAGVGGHSETGIMAKGGKAKNRECIDSASLELVCRTADCAVFKPECD